MAGDGTISNHAKIDLITFEVLRHRMWEINDEMGMIAARISGSPLVYESGDFNTAILTAKGEGLFTGVYVIRQASALDVLVQSVIKRFSGDIHDGDMFVTNDPWSGALHAMDYAVIAPVFWEDEIVAWTGVVMHEIDVGGPRPGSWIVGAHDAFQECMLMPPVRIVDKGRLNRDIETIYLRNTRTPDMNALNLRAKIAAQVTTRERLRDIIREYSKETFLALQEQIMDYVKTAVRKRIALIPDGTWYSNAFLDHDGVEDKLYRYKLKLTKKDDKLILDFTGTSKQAAGSVNCAYSGLIGGVVQTLFPLLCFDLPWSHGAIADCFEIISQEGTINNCTYPAATSMATVNSCQMTGNAIWEAMSRMYSCVDELREEVTGMCYGGINTAVLAAQRPDGRHFVNLFTDSIGGGGARSFRDGVDTCGNLVSPNYGIPNAERIESLFPLLYVYRKQTAETAGAGQYRGGVGLEYMVIPHGATGDIEATFFSSGVAHPEPKGASGGSPGSVQGNLVLREASVHERFVAGTIPYSPEEAGGKFDWPQAKDATTLKANDVWVCMCNGGGGYGDPLDRDPPSVARDVHLSLMTIDEAGRQYGVAIGASGAVDEARTTQLRADRRSGRMNRGKRLGEDWKPGLKFEGNQLFRYGENLAVRETQVGAAIGCLRCGHLLCAAHEDPRQRSLMVEEELSELSPLNVRGKEKEIVIRKFCCPGCATVFSTDVQLRTDDPRAPEMLLDAAQFAKPKARAAKEREHTPASAR
jgi:N-methylhydantoinase B/oxoprolinase/acetone carboxylase alpha subunit